MGVHVPHQQSSPTSLCKRASEPGSWLLDQLWELLPNCELFGGEESDGDNFELHDDDYCMGGEGGSGRGQR